MEQSKAKTTFDDAAPGTDETVLIGKLGTMWGTPYTYPTGSALEKMLTERTLEYMRTMRANGLNFSVRDIQKTVRSLLKQSRKARFFKVDAYGFAVPKGPYIDHVRAAKVKKAKRARTGRRRK